MEAAAGKIDYRIMDRPGMIKKPAAIK